MNRSKNLNAAQKSAQSHFTKAAASEGQAKQTVKQQRNAMEAKTSRLRELRMAKEAADKLEADKRVADGGAVVPPKRRRAAPAPKPTVVRFTY